MVVDLHNHTKRCNHASGECEEYILAALKCNTDIFGFADHAPMKFDEKYRMGLDEVESYRNDVLFLRDKYRDKIDIKLGLEVDFINKKEYLIEACVFDGLDYAIGSVHFLNNWGFDNEEFLSEYKHMDVNEIWIEYLESICAMANSGLFDIVGHFDLLKIFNHKPNDRLVKHIINALDSIKDNDMTLEINTAGLRKMIGEIYPSRDILQMAFTKEIPITFSSDAHSPSQVGFGRSEAIKVAREVGYKQVASFTMRKREFFDF